MINKNIDWETIRILSDIRAKYSLFESEELPYYHACSVAIGCLHHPVVHAHWKWDEDGMDWGIGAWVCSNCGLMFPYMDVALKENASIRKYAHANYCGCCGAKMDEEIS